MKLTKRQLRRIIREEMSHLREADKDNKHKDHLRAKNWGELGEKIEALKKKKSDYDFYTTYHSFGYSYVALPKGDTTTHKDQRKADPTNDELNQRSLGQHSDYFKD